MGQSLEICFCVKENDNDCGGEKTVLKHHAVGFAIRVNNNN
jgi:hypothetical protein